VGNPERLRETRTPSPEAVNKTSPEIGPRGPGTRLARAKVGGAAADTTLERRATDEASLNNIFERKRMCKGNNCEKKRALVRGRKW
jgi:hypothetical protein